MESLLSWPTNDCTRQTRVEIIRWWEANRLQYNIYVGIVGAASWLLVLIAGSAAVKPGVDFEEPLVMIAGPFWYAVMANVCYTLGWIVDATAFRGTPRIRLYKVGVLFSLVLTALPGLWAAIRMANNGHHRPEDGLTVGIPPSRNLAGQ